jgi:hypothetical protein
MGILDRPLFRRKLSKDELAMYGIQAFANGGIVSPYNMANGGPTDPSQLLPQTPPEEMYDSGFKSARETLEQAFMKKLNESGFVEELKKAQESGNKQMEDTLMSMYKEMYQREVVDPVEAGSASGNMGGFAVGGEVESEEEEEEDGVFTGVGGLDSTGRRKPFYPALMGQEAAIKRVEEFPEANQQGIIYKNEKEVKRIKETIRLKEEQGYDTTKDKENLKKKKEELENNSKELKKIKGEEKAVTEDLVTEDLVDNDKLGSAADDPEVAELDTVSRLQQLVKERSELYKQILGDPTKQMASQGFLQLAQFGLNLAAAQGSNFADKVAKSAKDPLTAFAKLAQDAQNDEKGIQLAALKSAEDLLQIETANAGKQATAEQEKKAIFASVYEATNSILNAAKAAGGIQNSLLQTSVVDLVTQFPF